QHRSSRVNTSIDDPLSLSMEKCNGESLFYFQREGWHLPSEDEEKGNRAMKVMEIATNWGLENLRAGTRPEPVAGPHDVVVQMQAASINYRDLVMARGGYGRRGGTLPMIPVSD